MRIEPFISLLYKGKRPLWFKRIRWHQRIIEKGGLDPDLMTEAYLFSDLSNGKYKACLGRQIRLVFLSVLLLLQAEL